MFLYYNIEGCQSSEDLTLGGGEGGAVVVGTRQTAAAVMAAAMVAIEAGERAERTVCCCVVLLYTLVIRCMAVSLGARCQALRAIPGATMTYPIHNGAKDNPFTWLIP